ncbi:hypothetical protein [Nocardia asiatica]
MYGWVVFGISLIAALAVLGGAVMVSLWWPARIPPDGETVEAIKARLAEPGVPEVPGDSPVIGYRESFLDGVIYVVDADGFSYTAEEHADLLEEQGIDRARRSSMALTDTEARVLRALAQVGTLTVRKLSARIQLSVSATRANAAALRRRGLATSTGGIPTYWRITGAGQREIAADRYCDITSPSRPRHPTGGNEAESTC